MIITRILVGVAAAFVLLFGLFFSKWTFSLLIAVASFISMWELTGALKRAGFNPLTWAGLLFSSAFIPASYFTGMEGVLALYAMLGFCAMAHRLFHPECTATDILATVFSLFYAGLPFVFVYFTFCLEPEGLGYTAILTGIACALSSDTFSFFIGTFWGRTKLLPQISPNKTVEGSVGGVVGSLVAALVLGLWVQTIWGLSIGLEHFIILGVLWPESRISGIYFRATAECWIG